MKLSQRQLHLLRNTNPVSFEKIASETVHHQVFDNADPVECQVNYYLTSKSVKTKTKTLERFYSRYFGFSKPDGFDGHLLKGCKSVDGTKEIIWAGTGLIEQNEKPGFTFFRYPDDYRSNYIPVVIVYCHLHDSHKFLWLRPYQPKKKLVPLCDECHFHGVQDSLLNDVQTASGSTQDLVRKMKDLEKQNESLNKMIGDLENEITILKDGIDACGHDYNKIYKAGQLMNLKN